jgi:putative oxidoreductase
MSIEKLIHWMLTPPLSGPRSTILIRCMAGGVFLWEGLLKFVYTNQGVGRFT